MNNRKAWLSAADVCALRYAQQLEASVSGAAALGRALRHRDFREFVHGACFGAAGRDHVLVTISEDMYAALRLMGLCGAQDARGRPVCVIDYLKKKLFAGPEAYVSMLSTLVRQYCILFSLRFPLLPDNDDLKATLESFLKAAFDVYAAPIARSIKDMAKSIDAANASGGKREATQTTGPQAFGRATASLEAELQKSMAARLSSAVLPPSLQELRKRADCAPSTGEAFRGSGSKKCQSLLDQHAHIFAARLAESVAADAVFHLRATAAAPFMTGLCAYSEPGNSSLKKMRLLWVEKGGALVSGRSLSALCGGSGFPNNIHFGLGSTSQSGKGTYWQDALTALTQRLTLLNSANARVQNFLSGEVLSSKISPTANPMFDNEYKAFVRGSKSDDPCSHFTHEQEQLALRYLETSFGIQGETLDEVTFSAPSLYDVIKAEVGRLNAALNNYRGPQSKTAFVRQMFLDRHDTGGPTRIPLTRPEKEDPGNYYLVQWLICHNRVPLGFSPPHVRGEYRSGRDVLGRVGTADRRLPYASGESGNYPFPKSPTPPPRNAAIPNPREPSCDFFMDGRIEGCLNSRPTNSKECCDAIGKRFWELSNENKHQGPIVKNARLCAKSLKEIFVCRTPEPSPSLPALPGSAVRSDVSPNAEPGESPPAPPPAGSPPQSPRSGAGTASSPSGFLTEDHSPNRRNGGQGAAAAEKTPPPLPPSLFVDTSTICANSLPEPGSCSSSTGTQECCKDLSSEWVGTGLFSEDLNFDNEAHKKHFLCYKALQKKHRCTPF